MTQADRVHSTPPINSSSTEAANPLPKEKLTGEPAAPEGFHKVVDPNGRIWFKADAPSKDAGR
jgi:hypothetical protein